MKSLIIYNSLHHNNTEKIAKAMANLLKAKLLKPNEINKNALSKYNLLGFGSGIYAGRHHKPLLELVDELPESNRKAFIFSTAGFSLLKPIWHKALKRKLLKKGFNIIGEFCCKGFNTCGPFKLIGGINKARPNEKDLKRAEEFVKGLR